MSHDPERDAGAYVGGVMRQRRARRFEAHILTCDACWREVSEGREGRRLAESDRTLAPQALRERVRAAVAAEDAPRARADVGVIDRIGVRARRPSPWPVAVAVIPVLVGVVALLLVTREPSQPGPIAAALVEFQTERLAADPARAIDGQAPDLSTVGLTLRHSGAGTLEGHPVNAHWYADPGGQGVLVYTSRSPFPTAEGARWDRADGPWRAQIEGVSFVCGREPTPMLALSEDHGLLEQLARALGMRGRSP